MGKSLIGGKFIDDDEILEFKGTPQPAVSRTDEARIYYDTDLDKLQVSENGGGYTYLTGGLATETDPVVGAVNGIVKADGIGNISAAIAGTDYLQNVVEDTTPQLGSSLDVNSQKIVSTSNGDIDIEPNGTGNVLLGNFTFNADQTVGAGQDNYVLTYDNAAGLISLEAATGGSSPLTTKGDLYTYSTVDARLGVGTDGYVLTADSGEATGLKWAAASGGTSAGQISRCKLNWTSSTAISLGAGSAMVAGTQLTWGSPLTWSGSSGSAPLNAVQVVYVYLYDSSGATIEASATVPVFNSTYDAYYKTGDATKRYVGYFRTWSDSGTVKIMKFYTLNLGTDGRTVEEYIISESNDVTLTNFIISQSITSTTTWHNLTSALSTLTPKFATHIWLDSRIFHGGDGNDAVLGVDVDDLGTGIAAYNALFHVRAQQSGTGSKKTFFGRSWVPLVTDAPVLYAKMFVVTGSATGEIYEHGARIYR